jgi:hypothetical protein
MMYDAASIFAHAQELAEALRASAAREKALREALLDALDYLYNPFEPDNQSATYKRIHKVVNADRAALQALADTGGGNG